MRRRIGQPSDHVLFLLKSQPTNNADINNGAKASKGFS